MYIAVVFCIVTIVATAKCRDDECPGESPICASDGITYKNLCLFDMAQQFDESLTVFHVGVCESDALRKRKEKETKKHKNKKKEIEVDDELKCIIVMCNVWFVRGQDQINDLKTEIKLEEEICAELEKNIEELETLLLEIKQLLYDLCKLLDIIPEPAMPEWTAEARDVHELVMVLTARYEKARIKVEDIKEKQQDTTIIVVPSNTTSAAASIAGVSLHSHSTPKESEKPIPTYKELVQKEPVKAPPSDEEEDIPSRCYLKRQAQLIVDTKCRRKGFRTPYPRR